MPPAAVVAALLSALIHAGWNTFLKGASGDRLVEIAVMGAGGTALGFALIAAFGSPQTAAWPYILASSLLHLVYWTALARGYGAGGMRNGYYVARGGAAQGV